MKVNLDLTPKRLPKIFWLVFLLLALYIVVNQFPANWVGGSVGRLTACRVILQQPIGTIWQGSAAIGFSESNLTEGGCKDPISVTERFHWATACKPLSMSCQTEIEFSALEQPQKIRWGLGGIDVVGNNIKLPANVLEGIGSPWSSLRPRGLLDGRWTDLHLGGSEGYSGIIRLIVSNLTSPISPVKPLGAYEIQANLSRETINWILTTTSGPLLLKGQGELGGVGLQFSGEAWASPEAQDSLIGLLSLIGKKEGDVYRLKF